MATTITLTLKREEQEDILSALNVMERYAWDSVERDRRCGLPEEAARHGRLFRRCHTLAERIRTAQDAQWRQEPLPTYPPLTKDAS